MGINSFFKDLFDFTNRNLPVLEENIIFEVPDKVVAPLPDLEGIALDIYNSLTTRYMEPRGDISYQNRVSYEYHKWTHHGQEMHVITDDLNYRNFICERGGRNEPSEWVLVDNWGMEKAQSDLLATKLVEFFTNEIKIRNAKALELKQAETFKKLLDDYRS